MRTFRAARCIGLLALVLLGSCVGGDGTDPSAPTYTLPLALQPVFPAGAATAQAQDINVIRVVVRAVPGGQVLTDQRFEVNPNAAAWDLDVSVPVVEGVTNVEILITLVHRAADGTETVEWSGQVSATLGGAASSQIRTIPVVRGPPDNLGVTGVSISPDPVPDIEEQATVQLSAAVSTDDPSATPTLFWTSSAPAVATVDPATGLVTGVTPGTATIRVDVGPASDQVSVTVIARPTEADLSLTKTVTPTSAFEGDTVTFVVVLANAGPAGVGAPQVSDVLPAGLALVSAEPTSGVYDADTGIWTPGALAAGPSETLRIRARVQPGTAGTTLTNTAEILPLLEQVDPDETNDVAQASVTVGVRTLDIALTKTVDVAAPNAGQTVVFTVRATNSGPSAATGVTVQDRLPAGLAFVSASTSQGSYVAGTGLWTVGALANGSVATLAVTARVEAAAGATVTNRATLSGVDQTDAVAANNTASAAVSVTAIDLALSKSVDVPTPGTGQNVVFAVTATNAGPSTATGVVIQDLLPAGLTFVSASASVGTYANGTGTWAVGSLASGGVATLSMTATVTAQAGTTIRNTATLAASDQVDTEPANNSASATVAVTGLDLALTKTVDNATPNTGQTVAFTVTATNNGPSAATGVAVSDALPAGLTFASATASQGAYSAETGLWTVGALANGASATLTLHATVSAAGGTTVTNTATLSAHDQADSNPENNSASASVTVQAIDLAVTKTVDNATPNTGQTVAFTVTATNNGPSAATGVAVSDALPAGLTFASATASQGAYSAETGLWTVGALANGASATLTLNATVSAAGGTTVTNTATLSAHDQPDANTANNTASASITVQAIDLAVTKTVDNATPNTGQTVAFTVTATNNGPSAATGVAVSDALPAGLTFASATASAGTYVQSTGIWTVGALANGASATLTLNATVSAAGGTTVTNTATLSAHDQPDANTANNSASASVTVQAIDLALTKTVDNATPNTGGFVTFTVTISNAGPSVATGVTVLDAVPSGISISPTTTPYNSTTGVWTVGSLPAGGTAVLTLSGQVTAAGGTTVTNTATLTAHDQTDTNAANNSASASITVQAVDLAVTKTVDNATPNTGQTVAFTVTATNNGPSSATNVALSDVLPSGLAFGSATASQGSYASGTGLWTVGTLATGASATLTISATVTAAGGTTVTNTASLSAHDQTDTNAANNSASASIDVRAVDLAVTKTVDNATPNSGQTVAFTVTVTNNGPSAATGVAVSDPLPAGLTFATATASVGTYDQGTGVWTVGSLANGSSATLTLAATVGLSVGTSATNTATLTAHDQADTNPANNAASATVTVPAVDLAVTKTVDNATPNQGDNVTFTITLTNNGPSAATNVRVSDVLPAGLDWVSGSATAGVYTSGTGIWAMGTVASGVTETLTITTNVSAAAGTTVTNTAIRFPPNEEDTNPANNSASASVTVTAVDLAVTKTVDVATPGPGGTVTFTVGVTNGGPSTATNVALSDALPTGLTFVSATASQGAYDNGTGIWTVGSLANSASATLSLVAMATAAPGTTVTNTASLSAHDQADTNAANNSASAAITVTSVDLAVTKTVDDATPHSGQTVTFSIGVTNNGPSAATNVIVSDVLPVGLSFVSFTSSQGFYDEDSGAAWTVGTLANGGSATLDLVATVTAAPGTSLTNTASLSAHDQSDSNAANNSASASLSVLAVDLALAKTVDVPGPVEGGQVTFQVTITNNGPDAATGVTVTDALPAGLTATGNTPSQGAWDGTTWTVGTLANGANATLDVVATVGGGRAGTTLTNTATLGTVTEGDTNAGNNSASASVAVQYLPLARNYTAPGNTQLRGGAYAAPATPHYSDGTTLISGTPGLVVTAGTFATTQGGTVTLEADGDFLYTPPTDFTGNDTFTYTVQTGTATVTVGVSEIIWWVDNRGSNSGASGRSHDPFPEISEGTNAAGPGEYVHVANGNGTTYESLSAGAGRMIYGEGVAFSVPGFGVLAPAGTAPTLQSGEGSALSLSTNGFAAGFRVDNDNGWGVSAFGAAGGTLEDIEIVANTAGGLRVVNGTGTFTFTRIDITHSSADEAILISGGSPTVNMEITNGSVTSSTGKMLHVAGTTAGTVTLTGGTMTSTNGQGILLDDVDGDVVVQNAVTITNPTTHGLTTSTSGSGDYTFDELHITSTGFKGVHLGYGTGTKTFGLVDINTTNETAFFAGDASQVDVTDGASTIVATGGQALALQASDLTHTGTVTFASVTSTNSPTRGIYLDDIDGTVTINGGTITDATSGGLVVTGGSADVTYAGAINQNNTAARSVQIVNRTGGTVHLSGNVSDTDGGIYIADNTTTTVARFSGTLTLSTAGNIAFQAIDDEGAGPSAGTIEVTGTGNTINNTNGTAIDIDDAVIGAGGVTFQSVSTSGAFDGIRVQNVTGGTFSVTGTGSAGSGGTLNDPTNTGVTLKNVAGASLAYMNITGDGDGSDDGILGIGTVTDLTVDNVVISDAGDRGIQIPDLRGTSAITNTTVSGSGSDNVQVEATSGALDLDVSGSTFQNASGGSGLAFNSRTSSAVSLVAAATSFLANNQQGLAAASMGEGPMAVTVTGNSQLNTNGVNGLWVFDSLNSVVTLSVTGSTIQDNVDNGIHLWNNFSSNAATGFRATIDNNTIRQDTPADARALIADLRGSSVNRLAIRNNDSESAGFGFNVRATGTTTDVDVTISNNTIVDSGVSSITLDSEMSSVVCANITGNTITHTNNTGIDVGQNQTSVFNLQGYPGGSVPTFLGGQNTISTGDGSDVVSTGTFGAATCTLP